MKSGKDQSGRSSRPGQQSPNCFKCRHFFITWEAGRGYACRAMGFKSRQVPWKVVLRESGLPCLMFSPKPPLKRGS